MKHQTKPISISCLLLLIFVVVFTSVVAQEVEDESEFDYKRGSEKGPDHWGHLKKEWAECNNGEMQSPIDMSNKRVKIIPKLDKLKINYHPSNATVKNRGHDIAVQWMGNAGSIKINGVEYFLQQLHWHSPSEHTINGRRYDMELHMVHVSSDPKVKNKIAVVGILYKTGEPDRFLSEIIEDIKSITDEKKEKYKGVIDPEGVKISGNMYYRYMGSLTVPPCTEGVIWTINKKIETVSREQVNLLRIAVHDYAEENARPVQPINDREIYLYGQIPEDNN